MDISKLKAGVNTLNRKTKIIKFEGDNSCLFWKIDGEIANSNARIVVPETHWVIYIKDGERQTLNSAGSVPIFNTKRNFLGMKKTDAATISVIFISRTAKVKNYWGLGKNPIEIFNKVINEPVSLFGSGSYEIKVTEPIKFYTEIVSSLDYYTLDTFQERVNDLVSIYVKDICANKIDGDNIEFFDMSKHILEISENVERKLTPKLLNDYGVTISNFIVNNLDLIEEDKQKVKTYFSNINKKKEYDEAYNMNKQIIEDNQKFKRQDLNDEAEFYSKIKKADGESNVNKINAYNDLFKTFTSYNSDDDNDDVDNNDNTTGDLKRFKYCFKCGTKCKKNERFCSKCGYEFVEKKYCPRCDNEVSPDAKFCSFCGKEL